MKILGISKVPGTFVRMWTVQNKEDLSKLQCEAMDRCYKRYTYGYLLLYSDFGRYLRFNWCQYAKELFCLQQKNLLRKTKEALKIKASFFLRKMGLEPTQLESYKILSLARLPVPTLPQATYPPSEDYNTTRPSKCQ